MSSTRWAKTVSRLRQRPDRGADNRRPEDVDADRRTDAVLRRLPAESWSIVSCATARHGAPDHVVVGPAGVYVIASRLPQGCVRVKDGVPWLRSGDDAQADRPGVGVSRKVIDPARHLNREIRLRSGHTAAVHPVVVLWSEFPQRVAETRQVAYVHGRNLAAWLLQREQELEAAPQAEIADAVEQAARHGIRRGPRVPRRRAA